MTEHDESFDRRVRELLATAQEDAPKPGDVHTAPRRNAPSIAVRVALVAAALLLVVVAVAVVGGRSGDRAVPADSTSVTPGPPSTTVPFQPVNCGAGLATPYEEVGSIHTVVPNPLPLEVAIVAPDGGCTGGDGEVSITLINPTDLAVDVEPTSVILASGMEKWVVGRLPATTLQPATSRSSCRRSRRARTSSRSTDSTHRRHSRWPVPRCAPRPISSPKWWTPGWPATMRTRR
jgi:hypothetical protein